MHNQHPWRKGTWCDSKLSEFHRPQSFKVSKFDVVGQVRQIPLLELPRQPDKEEEEEEGREKEEKSRRGAGAV